jgi:alkanesulfonate monooxygenase SsuD/methylene tetrahydromethanopterin reductase-like flavin-dependent oxidoreductase (luciferase family)
VNIWPRPIQKPHPPIWIPGGGSIETWEWTLRKGYLYAYLSYQGFKRGEVVMGGFWKKAEELGLPLNPYHAGFLQLVCVGESQGEVEDRYGEHGEYFYNKMLHVFPGFGDAPGYRTIATIKAGLLGQTGRFGDRPKTMTWNDLLKQGNIVAGTPSQVTEQLEQVIKKLRVGHLMVLNQFGSMPHEAVVRNIKLTGTRVLPKLRHLWGEWEDRWWPENARRMAPAAAGG